MRGNATTEFEKMRLAMQSSLDAAKVAAERNRMGQFATPTRLATDILRYAKMQLGKNEAIRFIDPAIGTGSFYSALLDVFSKSRVSTAVGYEIDPHYGLPSASFWRDRGLDINIGDFTQAEIPEDDSKFNLLICNPPYVRHHHIVNDEKQRLKACARDASGIEINGLAGLYCYFLAMGHAWMTSGGLAGWLLPSEFMDVNYGAAVKQYLLDKVMLLHIHRFDPNDVQFDDALVSSAVVWFCKTSPSVGHKVRFSYGGSLEQPKLDRMLPVDKLRHEPKWTCYPIRKIGEKVAEPVLSDLFDIKRGLATGGNNYFILSAGEIEQQRLPMWAFKPILPSPRYLPNNEIIADNKGNPILERQLFLLDCQEEEDKIKQLYPTLWAYLEKGKELGIAARYLCRHRSPWYAQERRPPAPFVCTYLGRENKNGKQPFRFILNNSQATAANVYLMLYPKKSVQSLLSNNPKRKREIWQFLNKISPTTMIGNGRVYGGGLHKLEPKELGNVPIGALADFLYRSSHVDLV